MVFGFLSGYGEEGGTCPHYSLLINTYCDILRKFKGLTVGEGRNLTLSCEVMPSSVHYDNAWTAHSHAGNGPVFVVYSKVNSGRLCGNKTALV